MHFPLARSIQLHLRATDRLNRELHPSSRISRLCSGKIRVSSYSPFRFVSLTISVPSLKDRRARLSGLFNLSPTRVSRSFNRVRVTSLLFWNISLPTFNLGVAKCPRKIPTKRWVQIAFNTCNMYKLEFKIVWSNDLTPFDSRYKTRYPIDTLDCQGETFGDYSANSRSPRSFNQSPFRPLESTRHFLRDISLGIFEHLHVKGSPRNRRLQTTTSAQALALSGILGMRRPFSGVSQASGKTAEISIVSRSLAFRSLLFPNIVARVPPLAFYRTMYKSPGRRGAGEREGELKGLRNGSPPARGANRYVAPFPPAVLRSAKWRCSCSCGRSCGWSVDDAFCGSGGRYAVMRIVANTTLSLPPTPLPRGQPRDKYLTGFTMPRAAHRKYRRHLFVNAPRYDVIRSRGRNVI